MSQAGVILVVIGGAVLLEGIGVPVISTLVGLIGDLVTEIVGTAVGGFFDAINPFNYV